MDSTEALFGNPRTQEDKWKSMKLEGLVLVARDGIEPPTPAFSGLRSTRPLARQEMAVDHPIQERSPLYCFGGTKAGRAMFGQCRRNC